MSKTRLRRTDPEKERYWRELVLGQAGSGQSVREYCRRADVRESAFYWWRRELARRSEAGEAARPRPARGRKVARSSAGHGRQPSRESNRRKRASREKPATAMFLGSRSVDNEPSPFVPIHLLSDNGVVHAAAVEIHLGDGRMVRVAPGFDRQTLVEVLGGLEVRSC